MHIDVNITMSRSYHGESTLSDAKFLVDQIRRTFNGDSWHGPSLMKTLEGVDFEQAKDKPLHGRHCIWEIVDHINFWMGEVSWAVENNRIYDEERYGLAPYGTIRRGLDCIG
jgi:hypothetical protein